MALSAAEKAKLSADFRSGRNPMAFLPLATGLRRERRYSEALEVCQQGVSQTNSASGRTLMARLLADVGRYDEGLATLESAQTQGATGTALHAEKARCLIALHRFDEAAAELELGEALDPMDPSLQAMRSELRSGRHRTGGSSAAVPRNAFMSMEEAGQAIAKLVGSVGNLLTIALLDLESGKSFVEGETEVLETAEVLHMENAQACGDLDFGQLTSTIVELAHGWVLIVRRERRMAVIVFESDASFGKWHHRINAVLKSVV